MSRKQKITTFLWFNNNAEEAARFYVSLFKNSRIVSFLRCGDAGPGPKGSVLTCTFELEGQEFMAMNGGPQVQFNQAISLMVNCDTQAEVDELWNKLTDGGSPSACGWLTDRFGLSWQITPTILLESIGDPDPARAKRAMEAMMTMSKIDIAQLKKAVAGG